MARGDLKEYTIDWNSSLNNSWRNYIKIINNLTCGYHLSWKNRCVWWNNCWYAAGENEAHILSRTLNNVDNSFLVSKNHMLFVLVYRRQMRRFLGVHLYESFSWKLTLRKKTKKNENCSMDRIENSLFYRHVKRNIYFLSATYDLFVTSHASFLLKYGNQKSNNTSFMFMNYRKKYQLTNVSSLAGLRRKK